ncbi:glutamate--tRNA ligase [Helicobacter winghamensis]|uniref:Glutamate--tRNA ligase n=1 Tax=Helicobacter winghamensis TaxID=157268 RepID=A0A2N3PHW3_9HELI|nr:glutamate--tRNA ligase [Helicobacter winghamensis]EEO25597.1 glutamate--tRNA ligase [Helicobacter winghamensis ATCC BAA-430]PKT77994.1 glutamate--tRNA ligase [Helicobacter winghamensis]PKT78256.1 glutamate--tRNA ligase [Helicobacter winghamensis]PKT78522.1 glutamate--tRNA ligase [Helicobacter winghamensis]PKT80149.1 glutamate--tRNA ligase [Helicobacter winghamensis]
MLRFAPSPTGDMHTGNLRAAVFNYILAKQRNEKFLLRIEDTDTARNIEGKDKDIMFLLSLFGITWDNLVYQSHNFERHRQLAEYLIKQGNAFYCYCTKEFLDSKREIAKANHQAFRYDDSWAELQKDKNPHPVVRLKAPKEQMQFHDEIKGDIVFAPNEIDSFIILKEDGIPTYNFACAVDDMLYDIDFIVRGEDHVSNTPKQMLIHHYLNYEKTIKFAHLPIILNEEGKKMSKRDNASSVQWLLDCGFLPQAIVNYLVLMGNKTPCEVFSLKDTFEWFDITKVAKAPARFDIDKLKFLNREHFKKLSEQDLAVLLGYKDSTIGALAKLYLQEASTLNEIREKVDCIFAKKALLLEQNMESKNQEAQEILEFKDAINTLQLALLSLLKEQDFKRAEFDAFKTQAMQVSGLKGKHFFKPLRFLLTGHTHGPELSDLFPYLRLYLDDILRN